MSRNLLKVALLAFISLAGCSLVRDQAYNLGYKDRRALDTLRKQPLYSLKANGVFDQKDHELILFDGDILTMRFAHMINGVENALAEYSVEVIEDSSALEGVYRLYGTGPLSGKYLGLTLLTNNNGAYAKLNFQDAPDSVLEGARAQAEWNWVTDPLAFRSFKTFPVGVPVVYLSDSAAASPATGGTNASTRQQDLRFIKLAHPDQNFHTNVIASVNSNGTANLSDDVYTLQFNQVWPNGLNMNSSEVSQEIITYEVRSVRMVAPNTEIYGVVIKSIGTTGFTDSPIATPGSPFSVGATGFLSIEFSYDADRVKTASRMAFDVVEVNALAEMQRRSLFRWESISTADLPTRVLDRFNGQPLVKVTPYNTDEITPNRRARIPLAYNAENTREFHFDVTNFSVRVLDVASRVTNAVTYRFRMVDDTSTNEGVVQLQGSVGLLAGQYFHLRHYYPAAGAVTHGATTAPDTFVPGTGTPGQSRPADDVRLLIKIGQGASEADAKTAVNTTDNDQASNIIYQSKTNAYKPHRLFVNMHKRGGSWVGVQDDGNYNTEAATNWNINSISRVVQVRISTNAAAKFSTYRFHTLVDVSDNRIVAVLSNIPNQTAPGDMRDNFLEPDLDPVFPNSDNDASRPDLSPFHGKYVALELGTGVDNTRAKVEYADSLSEALKKLDNRTAWNLYESTAVPTPNRVIKTLAASSPWIRLDKDGFFNSTDTERLNFDADDMTATVFWHRGSAPTMDANIAAAAKYTIPLPMEADTSLQEGIFVMRSGAASTIKVPVPGGSPGSFYDLPSENGLTLETDDGGAYKYAESSTQPYYYSALVGTLSDANKARVGKAGSRADAEANRAALGNAWAWHTLADAPLSPGVILHLMRTTAENGNSPLITSETAYELTGAGAPDGSFLYKPYATYEYEFANSPSLQVTIRRIQDTAITTAVYPLVVVNNISKDKTIVRLGGTATLGNYAPGRFMLIRIASDVDTTAAANKVYATNAAVSVFPTQSDAENYTGRVTTISMGEITTSADFDAKYNIRLKRTVAFNLAQLPFSKTYQLLLPHKIATDEFYDTYDIFNPNFQGSAYVRFTNLSATASPDYRIDIKDANNIDFSSYSYEVMAETPADNTLYVKLNGEGGLYHNRFAAFRFNRAHNNANRPDSMHAVIGQNVFANLSSMLAAQKATEGTTGWRYRALDVLTNKDFRTFGALAKADRLSTRIGSFVRVDKNGVFRSQDTDIFTFNFPTAGGESVTNMQVSITAKKPDGTESTALYYFVPLKNTPNNATPNNGASEGSGVGANDIQRGYLMHGYLISIVHGVNGSTSLVPYNRHFVILRTDVVNNPAAPNDDQVRSVIIATNNTALGIIGDTAAETGATTAYALYNFWWSNGTNVIGTSAIPGLAFNFRAQASTDINSRIIDHMAANPWVVLNNLPAASLGTAQRYVYDPDNRETWEFNSLSRRVTVTTITNGGTPEVGTYDIQMRESDNDFEGYVQLSSANPTDRYFQRFVYLKIPGVANNESAEIADRRTRDARIIVGGSTVIGTGTTPVANTIAALKQARADMMAEAAPPAFGEWNAANANIATINEQALANFHRRGRTFFTYETGTSAVDPSANNRDSSDQWNPNHWLSFMPVIRQRAGVDSKITNMLLQRKGLAGADYNYTNIIKLMQADAGRTVLQLAGTNAQATASVNFSNLFMGIEYGNDVNDRTAKIVYSSNRAGVIEALNLRTTYNYFDSEMATNSKNHEKLIEVALGSDRGFEWVQVSNTIHNAPGANPPGLPNLPGVYSPAMQAAGNLTDSGSYEIVTYNATSTTNFVFDHGNKIVQEMRVSGSTTNIFVYGYTVIESSLIPNIGGTTTREDNKRYRFVVRLEGFGDYKNYFAAGEIGRYDARTADTAADGSPGSTTALGEESERFKARIMFGKTVAQAKAALTYLQGTSGIANAPTVGTWNLVSKTVLTMPSPLLDSTFTVSGYPTAPASRRYGLNGRTGDPSLIDPAGNPTTVNANYYARLASATGEQNNVIDPDNHTNFAFWNVNSEPVVYITTVQSNVSSTVRYKAVVRENYFNSPLGSRRSNDVILWLDNLGSPLHSYFIGIRRHNVAPGATNNDLRGDVYSMVIDSSEATVQAGMGNVNLTTAPTVQLPMVLRFSNDMARAANGDNPVPAPTGGNAPNTPSRIIEHFTSANAGSFATLDTDGIYMNLSNAQWNYNTATKLMTINYSSPGGTFLDPFTGNNKTSPESYRVIPVLTIGSDSSTSFGRGIVLFRSDTSGGGAAGDLHNKYIAVGYHGNEAVAGAFNSADLVYLSHHDSIGAARTAVINNTAADLAKFTTVRPYQGLDLSPLNYMMSVRDPDNNNNLPGVWAMLNTSTSTKRYQLDPSNTTLYKVDLDNRILYEERIVTPLASGTLEYTTSKRSAVEYRINLVRSIPTFAAAGYQNYSNQITFTAVKGKAYAAGTQAPITGESIDEVSTNTGDKYIVVRTKKRTSSSTVAPPTWENISPESLYIVVTNRVLNNYLEAHNFLDSTLNPDPYGVAAFTTSVRREALDYWNTFMGQNDWWMMTTPKNTFATNKYDPSSTVPPTGNSLALTFDANTGNGGNSHGDGGLTNGVVNVSVGFQPVGMISGTPSDARIYTQRKMLNFWQRLIRQVDADTFIFQLYGGQNMNLFGHTNYTSDGISYTAEGIRSAVSNKYWIIRSGQGVDLFRSRVTNGSTPAEALQNLGLLTSPNLSPDRGMNRIVYSNITKGVDFIGNADIDITGPAPADAGAITALPSAERDKLYSNRAPGRFEVDNHTNWNFGPDLNDPAVTITIRSNVAGVVGEQTITYGITPLYSPEIGADRRALYALTGFGPFAGRLFSVVLNTPANGVRNMRIVMAPPTISRGMTGSATNANLAFLFNSMNSASMDNNTDMGRRTWVAHNSSGPTVWANPSFFNFVTKSSLNVDAGILSEIDNGSRRIVFKTGAFSAANTALVPKHIYDTEVTTNYAVDINTSPPTIIIQPAGESAATYPMGGASRVETINNHLVMGDNGTNITTTANVGAVRLGASSEYLGIKILSTNTTTGDAGIHLVRLTDTTADALQKAVDAAKALTGVPAHSYIRDVVTTSRALEDLEAAGPITSLNYYRGFDARNSLEWIFNKTASTVIATRLQDGAINNAVVYQTILVKDFAKLSTDAALNDTSDLYAAILLKSTTSGTDPLGFANKIFFIRRKANDTDAPLSKNDFKIIIGDSTNTGLTGLGGAVSVFGSWTNTAKNLFTGGSINGVTYALPTSGTPNPPNMAIPQTNFQLLSTLFGGHWSKLYATTGAGDKTLDYLYRKTDTIEYLFDDVRKLIIQRNVSGGATNAFIYSAWLSNLNPTTTDPSAGSGYTGRDNLSAGDRGTLYLQTIGELKNSGDVFSNLTFDTDGKLNNTHFTGNSPNTGAIVSKFLSIKFGHNDHITRATAASIADQGTSLARVFPPDNTAANGTRYRDLYDTFFLGAAGSPEAAIRTRRGLEFRDPYFIPAVHANASELLLVSAARQIQAQSSGTPVNEHWKYDAVSNLAPLEVGGQYHLVYDFNSGNGTGNSPGMPYNVNVNITLGHSGGAVNSQTNAVLGFGTAVNPVTYAGGRAKFLIRTIEANADGTEGVVRFYFGQNLGAYLGNGEAFGLNTWDRATNQNIANGFQLSNRYLAIKIGTGTDMHTAKFVWGNTPAEAKANMAAQTHYNMASFQLSERTSENTMRQFERDDGSAFVGPFVYGSTDDYTIYTRGQDDREARIFSIWKTSEKPATAAQLRLNQYQYKELFFEPGYKSEADDGPYFDTFGGTQNSDGTRAGVLIGFGPLGGRIIRFRGAATPGVQGGFSLHTFANILPGNLGYRHLRIARNAFELTNQWKNPPVSAQTNATNTAGAAY